MQVILVSPDIPQNTGNIGRTCVANNIPLHLVKPMGFSLEDKYLKRSGLDYWQHLEVHVHPSVRALEKAPFWNIQSLFLFSQHGKKSFWEAEFTHESVLVFGSETKGLPGAFIKKYQDHVYSIPMGGPIRSLNVSSSVAVVIYEALRQVRNRSSLKC